jgi:precorrin-6Y C5,15-methyltransferase (decarboxylating)
MLDAGFFNLAPCDLQPTTTSITHHASRITHPPRTSMKPVSVIGMGLSPKDLTAEHLKRIKEADILIGGKRHLEFFKDSPAQKKEIHKNLNEITEFIKSRMEKESVVVIASGDPLFFGIGNLLIKTLGSENVCIYPNITSLGAAFSRIKEPWHDAFVISIHGRFSENEVLSAFEQKDKIAVFTDPVKNPAWLANFLLKNSMPHFKMCVLEQLGSPSETVDWYDLHQAADKEFSDPNIVVLRRIPLSSEEGIGKDELHIGMPEECYNHEKGLITKAEIRAVTLSKLCLSSPGHILWDLGAGSGSVSIEASLFIRTGKIFAVEQKPERIEQIKRNKKRFGANNLEIIQAVLPRGLENLPKPDRIFIGGGGKKLEEIIRISAGYLNPGGIVVLNTVLIQNLETALTTLKRIGFKSDVVQIQISRGKDMPWGQRLEAQNPVWIIKGIENWKLEIDNC